MLVLSSEVLIVKQFKAKQVARYEDVMLPVDSCMR